MEDIVFRSAELFERIETSPKGSEDEIHYHKNPVEGRVAFRDGDESNNIKSAYLAIARTDGMQSAVIVEKDQIVYIDESFGVKITIKKDEIIVNRGCEEDGENLTAFIEKDALMFHDQKTNLHGGIRGVQAVLRRDSEISSEYWDMSVKQPNSASDTNKLMAVESTDPA